jgi:chorismate mutase / prephenate dehydratase
MYKTPELDAIRQKIDQLDNTIHDLLMERADLVMQISEEKKKNGIQIVQPAREARMIRRLMARHRAPLPEETIVRIWRELVGSISLLQTGLSVVVSATAQAPDMWDMAKDYFGSVLPMQRVATPMQALSLVREKKVTFAVCPYPEFEQEQPWWLSLADRTGDNLNIIQRLPYGSKDNYSFDQTPCLVVAQSGFDSSDEDRSFLLMRTDGSLSRSKIFDLFKESDLKPLQLYTCKSRESQSSATHLLELDLYIKDAADERLQNVAKKMGDENAQFFCVGGYPAPLTYPKRIKKEEER